MEFLIKKHSQLTQHERHIKNVFNALNEGHKNGVMQLYTNDENYTGRSVRIQGHELLNFFSCSYLGLELHPNLINGSIDASGRFGTQLSASRGYVSCGLYEELEALLMQIFNGYPIVSASTTLGHMNNIPLLVGDNDCVIFDWQVHASVQSALDHVRVRGVHVEHLLHNDLDALEEKLILYKNKYDKVWYMADGIYSMYGDAIPAQRIEQLLNAYENFHLYVDDAHGMSWAGENGRGYFLNQVELNEKTILTTSLAKAFGVTGGVTIVKSQSLQKMLRTCGKSLIFSGPLTPPILGACIEAAKIHVSDEISSLQAQLSDRICYANYLLKRYELPVFFETDTPICFVGVGAKSVGYNLLKRLYNEGYLVNIAVYPAVSLKRTGIRFTINLHQSEEMLHNMIQSIAHNLEIALAEEGLDKQSIKKAFNLENVSVERKQKEVIAQ